VTRGEDGFVKQGFKSVRALAVALGLALVAMPATTAITPATAQQTGVAPRTGAAGDSGRNPTADSVNEEALFRTNDKLRGTVTLPDAKASVLEQPQGRDYRQFREAWLPWIGAIAILGMLLGLSLFYFTRGRIRLDHSEESGRKILRFKAFERFSHWMTATCFIVLAITGLNYIFGKRLLMPLIGPDAFAAFSQWGKYAHTFLSWPFMLGVLFMIVVWIRDNVPNRVDWVWLKRGGGFLGDAHPDAGRFNAGQKIIFWIVALFGIAMSATGIIMLFPFSAADINGMQIAQYVHATIGVIFIAVMIAHIYIGSLGMEGAYDAMGSGEVDLAWARRHHRLWVEQQQAKTASGRQRVSRPAPAE
jgi:formate dehydrogenase subunit gamma